MVSLLFCATNCKTYAPISLITRRLWIPPERNSHSLYFIQSCIRRNFKTTSGIVVYSCFESTNFNCSCNYHNKDINPDVTLLHVINSVCVSFCSLFLIAWSRVEAISLILYFYFPPLNFLIPFLSRFHGLFAEEIQIKCWRSLYKHCWRSGRFISDEPVDGIVAFRSDCFIRAICIQRPLVLINLLSNSLGRY